MITISQGILYVVIYLVIGFIIGITDMIIGIKKYKEDYFYPNFIMILMFFWIILIPCCLVAWILEKLYNIYLKIYKKVFVKMNKKINKNK